MNKANKVASILILLGFMITACAPATTSVVATAVPSSSIQLQNGQKLNLNTVSGDELLAVIPGFPSRMVREFQEYRPYVSIQQFRREIGKYIGDAQVAEYEKYVYVPIAYNSSDSDTLQQIPGLDAAEAEALIAARPFASQEEFLIKLSQYVAPDQMEIAKTYLGTTS